MTRVLRDLRRDELTLKDMSVLRETEFARTQAKKTIGHLKDYSLQHTVSMHWGEDFVEGKRDLRPFQLRIDGRKYLLSWGELKDMDSAGFFRRETGNPPTYRLHFYDGAKVTLDTRLNDEATRDMIVRLEADGQEVFLDWYEVLKSGRFI